MAELGGTRTQWSPEAWILGLLLSLLIHRMTLPTKTQFMYLYVSVYIIYLNERERRAEEGLCQQESGRPGFRCLPYPGHTCYV